MNQSVGGAIGDWTSGVISIQRLRLDIKLSFAVLLLAFATRGSAARLRAIVRDIHQRQRDDV